MRSATLSLVALFLIPTLLVWSVQDRVAGGLRSPRLALATEGGVGASERATDELVMPPLTSRTLGPAGASSARVGKAPLLASDAEERAGPHTARVRVRGRVCRAGRALAGYDLSFLEPRPGAEPEERDWDFTDEEGAYEVELRPGRYLVRDELGHDVTVVLVPAEQAESSLDIDLGPAAEGR